MIERKRTRLKDFDYSFQNFYFITICTLNKQRMFGTVKGENVIINKKGKIVKECWREITEHFTNVELDEFIVMPNHFHAIVIISGRVGLRSPQPEIKTKYFSLSQIVAYFKHQSTKRISELSNKDEKNKIWQRSFYDRIIRNEKELKNIRKYIFYNALKWSDDSGNENLDLYV